MSKEEATQYLQKLSLKEGDSRQFKIDETKFSGSFEGKTAQTGRDEIVKSLVHSESLKERAYEFGDNQITSTVNLQRVKGDEIKSFDKTLPMPKKLQQNLNTAASKLETSNRMFDLQKQIDGHKRVEILKKLARSHSVEMRSKASSDETTSFQTSLISSDDRQQTHFLAKSKSQSSIQKSLPEFMHSETNLYYSKTFIPDEFSVQTEIGDKLDQQTLLNTNAVSSTSTEIYSPIEKMSKEEATQYLQKLSLKEGDSRQFKISQADVSTNLQKSEIPDEKKEFTQKISNEEFAKSKAYEFGENQITSTLNLQRVKGDEIKSFDKTLPTAKLLQHHLHTPSSKLETSNRMFDLQKQIDGHKRVEVLKKLARSHSVEMRSKASSDKTTSFQTSLISSDDRQQAHFLAKSKSQSSIQKNLPEFMHSETNLYYSKTFIPDEFATYTQIGDKLDQQTIFNTNAVSSSDANFSSQIDKMSKEEATQYLQKLSLKEGDSRQFKISDEKSAQEFEKRQQSENFQSIFPTPIEQKTEKKIPQFGQESTLTSASFQHVSRSQSADRIEKKLSDKQSIRDSLQTKAATEEQQNNEGVLGRPDATLSAEFVSKSALRDKTELRSKSMSDVTALFKGEFEDKLREKSAERIFRCRSKALANKSVTAFSDKVFGKIEQTTVVDSSQQVETRLPEKTAKMHETAERSVRSASPLESRVVPPPSQFIQYPIETQCEVPSDILRQPQQTSSVFEKLTIREEEDQQRQIAEQLAHLGTIQQKTFEERKESEEYRTFNASLSRSESLEKTKSIMKSSSKTDVSASITPVFTEEVKNEQVANIQRQLETISSQEPSRVSY
jgi:predicted DNA-binding antitoxin AbrB/MazE fold protein